MSRWCRIRRAVRGRFPRVSGDEPRPLMPACTDGWFSPRERG